MSKRTVLAEPTLVGREKELEELKQFLNLAVQGKGRTVFVSGEAGSGKSRLIRELLKDAKEKCVGIMEGWCLADSGAPYFPFVEAFNSYFTNASDSDQVSSLQSESPLGFAEASEIVGKQQGIAAWLTGSAPVLPGRFGRSEGLSPQAWKDQVFAGVVKVLQAAAAREPLILFIEDIHWADSASLSLLHYIARATKDREKVLLLATYRSDELNVDAEGRPHPLAETFRLMNREDLYFEIKLSGLAQAEVSRLVESLVGGCVDAKLSERLAGDSRGNPLFVVETMRMLNDRKSLHLEDNCWRLGIDELALPSKIKDIILRRLSVLKFPQRRVLDAACVIGERFDVELLSTVLGLDVLDVLETLNVVAQSTSLVAVEGNVYRFDHARSRETLYGELAVPLKSGYHTKIAQKLESVTKKGKLPFSDLSFHFAQAGNIEKAVKYALDAGQEALERFSNVEAIKHYTYVLQVIPQNLENASIKSTALERLGDSYFANRMYSKAFEVFERLADSETGKARLRAYRKSLDAFFWGPHDFKRLRELAKRADQFATFDRLESARIRLFTSPTIEPRENRIKEINTVLQIFEEEYSIPDIARTLAIRSIFEARGSLDKKSLSDAQRSITMEKELGDSDRLSSALMTSAQVFLAAGLLHEAWEDLTELLRIAEKIGDHHRWGNGSVMLSRLLEIGGKTEEALCASLKAFEYYKKTDAKRRQDRMLADLARQYAKLGNLTGAEECIKQMTSMDPVIMNNIDPEGLLNKRDSVRSQAVFFAATNRWAEAYQYIEKALELTEKVPMYLKFSQIVVRTDYAWVLNKQGRSEEAKIQLGEIQKLYDEVDNEYAYVSIDANVLARQNVVVEEEFELRLDLVNVSRKTGLLAKIEEVAPFEFIFIDSPTSHIADNRFLDLKEDKIEPFEVKTIKLKLKASKPGSYILNPQVTYIDELGKIQTFKSNSTRIAVKPALPKYETLPDRVATGFDDLDALLFGGIPEKYAAVLSGSFTNERDRLVRRFLETGVKSGETTFFISVEPGSAKKLVDEYPSNFFLFICNPQADALIQSKPNVFKLKGIENLTNIDIELVKAFRTLNPLATEPKRICIEVLSDALLQHHALTTRRWLSALLPTLKSKGFTTLAVIDPQMHPPEELQAVLSVFDGEIRITEKETPEGTKQTLKIRKLINQKYSDKEIILNKESSRN